MFNIDYELNEKVHSMIINPYLSWDELNANCDLIQKYNIRNVSTSLNLLSHIKNALSNHKVNLTTFISIHLLMCQLILLMNWFAMQKMQVQS